MYMSKTTQRLLAQQQKGSKPPAGNALNASASSAAGGAYSSPSPPPPAAAMSGTVPAGHLPVRHKRLDTDVAAAEGELASVIPRGSFLDSPMPLAAQRLASHNELATRATKSDAQETVVRTADSPLLLGPVAAKSAAAAAAALNRSTLSPAFGSSVNIPPRGAAPSPSTLRKGASTTTTVPPRPPSQQQSVAARTGADAVSTLGRTASNVGAGSNGGARPAASPSVMGDSEANDNASVAAGTDFAAELEEIGKQLKAEQQGNARARHRAALSQAQALRDTLGGGGGPSPSPTSGAATAFNANNYDATSSTADAPGYEDAESENSRTATGKPLHVLYTPDIRAKLPPGTAAHSHLAPKPMCLRDYEMLAEACQRAGRARTESHAYYKIGEHLSLKAETRPKAVAYFKRYLNLSRRLNDLQGEAKALNCLGVVHHEMGGAENLAIALDYHQQHAAIADAAGVFIANTNMGLAYKKLGDATAALQCFKNTLKYAVRAGDRAAESLALANLGMAGTEAGDYATARVCVERHLELSAALQDPASSCEAHEQLGVLAGQRGDHAAAVASFTQALEASLRQGDQEKALSLRCQIGLAQGMLRAEQALAAKASDMGFGSSSM